MGEFIFCYPDLADVANAPLLNQVENYRGIQTHDVIAPPLATPGAVSSVNQALPVSLSWSPKGMARWYELDIATNPEFSTPVVQEPDQTVANYVLNTPLPDTTYYYRVRTHNDAGASAWSVGSFQTVAPMIRVTTPNGYEAWRRGMQYYIQWNDNIAESVVIDLYKGGVFLKTLATTTSAGAWQWEPGLDLAPGNDYSIRVRSSTEPALFAVSAAAFGIDVPYINPGSLIRLPNGQVQFSLTAPGREPGQGAGLDQSRRLAGSGDGAGDQRQRDLHRRHRAWHAGQVLSAECRALIILRIAALATLVIPVATRKRRFRSRPPWLAGWKEQTAGNIEATCQARVLRPIC